MCAAAIAQRAKNIWCAQAPAVPSRCSRAGRTRAARSADASTWHVVVDAGAQFALCLLIAALDGVVLELCTAALRLPRRVGHAGGRCETVRFPFERDYDAVWQRVAAQGPLAFPIGDAAGRAQNSRRVLRASVAQLSVLLSARGVVCDCRRWGRGHASAMRLDLRQLGRFRPSVLAAR